LLDKALARFDWANAQHDVKRRRGRGELAGVGLACFVEKTGLGPKDAVRISLTKSGEVELVTGGASLGQGYETVMAQICADVLGTDYSKIAVVHGQTDRIADGIGAHASRATVMTGSAAHDGALKLHHMLLESAAEFLQSAPGNLEIRDGRVVRQDDATGPSISFAELARVAGAITAEGVHRSEHMAYPYGVHLAQVRIDPDTGAVAIERYLVAYDIGRAVNPMMIVGQIAGGFAQGLGGALFEEFLYSPEGQPLSVSFADYLIPASCEVPNVEVLLTEDAPSPLNPLGLKGSGEAGVTAVGAALASAIDDAIGIPLAIRELPVTPQKMLELLGRK
jgi:CO/xanthine dehydrogenase Mo-binding subunit